LGDISQNQQQQDDIQAIENLSVPNPNPHHNLDYGGSLRTSLNLDCYNLEGSVDRRKGFNLPDNFTDDPVKLLRKKKGESQVGIIALAARILCEL
jgi:hypothetical protein